MREVTVIVPVYNGEKYLEESLASVVAQDVDAEIHVLDDGSIDRSESIARSFSDPRLRYSKNPGRFGLFKTLNRGFREAETPLVRIWAHDDRMVSGSLRRFIEFAGTHPTAGVVFCRFLDMDPEGRLTGLEAQFDRQWPRVPELFRDQLAALLFWCYGCLPGNISTVMMRRETWERLGGFVEGIQQAPDYDMWVRASEVADVGFIDEPLVELRNHPGQLSKEAGKLMTIIEEELPVIRRLEGRLQGLLSARDLRRGWRWWHGRSHVHYVARAILRGDLKSAGRGLRAVRAYGQPLEQLVVWLLSGNGRVFSLAREKVFDEAVKRLALPTGGQPATGSVHSLPPGRAAG